MVGWLTHRFLNIVAATLSFFSFSYLLGHNLASMIVFCRVHDDFFKRLEWENFKFAFVEQVVVVWYVFDDTALCKLEFSYIRHAIQHMVLFLDVLWRHVP